MKCFVLLLLIGAAGGGPARAVPEESWPVNAAGFELDLADLPSPHPRPAPGMVEPLDQANEAFVRIRIPWSLIEKIPGQYDWLVADELVGSLAGAGFRLVLQPVHGNDLYDADSDDAWHRFLRILASRYGDRAGYYVLGGRIQGLPARQAAFRFKNAAVVVRSANPGLRIILGDLQTGGGSGIDSFLAALYDEEIAPYVDGISLAGPGAGDAIAAIRGVLLLKDPSTPIWLAGQTVSGGAEAAGRLLRTYLRGVEKEADLVLFRLDSGPDGMPALMPALERIRASFLPSYSPLVESARGIQVVTTMGSPLSVWTFRLFDAEAKKVLVAYDGGEDSQRGAQAVMAIDTVDLANPVLRDVAAGESAPLQAFQKDEAAALTRVALPLADYPLLLEYDRFTSPLFGEEEKLEITERRLASVTEIIARHQAFQAAQDALLFNMRADARIDYHFAIGTGSTVDVAVINTFFYDPEVGAEFEQREFYVNGVKWRSNRIPEFPIPQPEKVLTLPLDIALDKRYAYEIVDEERVGDRDCWVIEFRPLDTDSSLYKGRVWIDKGTYARVRVSSLQTGLEPPILSNDEVDTYRPLQGPEGAWHWVLDRIEGQQVFSASGRNLVLNREVTFTNHVINDSSFEEIRKQAYGSDRRMLRDTPSGLRYLERTEEGGRVVKSEIDRDSLFLLGGAFYNRSLDFPVPLAGANYFNRNLFGRNIQSNVFFAGVLVFANISDPDLFGSGWEASADLSLQGFSSTDRPVRGGEEIEPENVDLTTQRLTVGMGLPFSDYWKVKWTGSIEFQGHAKDEETDRGFTIPRDTYATSFGMQGEFNRDAWNVRAEIAATRRADWECWGYCDPSVGGAFREFREETKDYLKYEASVSKNFFLPFNQKVHASVSMFGGEDLDRFSKYRFGFFDNRLRGLSGTGLRFTKGTKAELQYAFNLGEIIRFDASIDHARVKDDQFPELGEDDYRNFTGVGFSGQTIIGPNLIVSLDWGIAVSSDIREFRGDQEVFITILKLLR